MLNNKNKSKDDSLKKRYFFKLFTNFIGFFLNLVIQAIVPRGLGPKAYGDFSFLTNFFAQAFGFLDGGTSTCFYTKLSQKPKEQGLVSFYFILMGAVFTLIALFVALTFVTSVYHVVWPNQGIPFICLAFGLGFLMWVANIINLMTDAYGLTVSAEILKICQKFIAILILLGLFLSQCLNLKNFFFYNYAIWLIFVALLLTLIFKRGYLIKDGFGIVVSKAKEYKKEFWAYSRPIFGVSLVALFAGVFERWFLQVYGGSAQQGFYGLAYQIGAICFLFTGAMAPIFLRELSIAHGESDLARIQEIFRKYVLLFYAITAYFSCFIAIEARRVVYIFGGPSFDGAIIPVAIMAFYPIHQTYGQLSSSVFFATSQTKLYSNIGIIFTLVGLLVMYFFIAPPQLMGMNAGAVGLAVKMVALNIIGVNVQLYFNAMQLRFNFWRYLGHQVITVGILFGLALSADFSATYLLKFSGNITVFIVSGAFYSVLVAVAIYKFPEILGMRRENIISFIRRINFRNSFGTV